MKIVAAVWAVVWLLEVFLTGAGDTHGVLGVFEPLALVPASVFQRGHVWQVVTYSFLHEPSNVLAVFFSVLAVWFAGSPLEERWGARRTLTLLGIAGIVGGVATLAVGLLHAEIYRGITVSPAAGCSALIAAWAALNAQQRVSLMGLATVKILHLLWVIVALTFLQLLWNRNGASVAALAGLGVGWLYAIRGTVPTRIRSERYRVIRGGKDLPN
jgi:membrane associated rhomboid family serine protease